MGSIFGFENGQVGALWAPGALFHVDRVGFPGVAGGAAPGVLIHQAGVGLRQQLAARGFGDLLEGEDDLVPLPFYLIPASRCSAIQSQTISSSSSQLQSAGRLMMNLCRKSECRDAAVSFERV